MSPKPLKRLEYHAQKPQANRGPGYQELYKLAQRYGAALPASRAAPELEPPPPIPPPTPQEIASARSILVIQRTNSPLYKDPREQRRRVFRSKEKTSSLANPDTWAFTPEEIARALDSRFAEGNDGGIGIAQYLIHLARSSHSVSVQQLWAIAQFWKSTRQSTESRQGPMACSWVLFAVKSGSSELVSLLCADGSFTDTLDSFVQPALEHGVDVTRELLRHGASLDKCEGFLMEAVDRKDLPLIQLWVHAESHILSSHFRLALLRSLALLKADPAQEKIISFMLSNIPWTDDALQSILLSAVNTTNPLVVSLVLLEASVLLESTSQLFGANALPSIKDAVFSIQTPSSRTPILNLLVIAGMDADSPRLRTELLDSLKEERFEDSLVLLRHGTRQDKGDFRALEWAVEHNLHQILPQIRATSEAASRALGKIPADTPEELQIETVLALAKMGAEPTFLSERLILAAQSRLQRLSSVLVGCGARVDHRNGRALAIALQHKDFGMLDSLLATECPADLTRRLLPKAMAMNHPEDRYQAMRRLLPRSATGPELDQSLLKAVMFEGVAQDGRLIQLLLKHGASSEYIEDDQNCLCLAVQRQDTSLVKGLVLACSSKIVLNSALALIPKMMKVRVRKEESRVSMTVAVPESKVLAILLAVLAGGHKDLALGEILVASIAAVYFDVTKAALQHPSKIPDADFGKAFETCFEFSNLASLKLLCGSADLSPKTLYSQAIHALSQDPCDCNLLAVILETCRRRDGFPLANFLKIPQLEDHSQRTKLVRMLLDSGARVALSGWNLVSKAIIEGDTPMLLTLLSSLTISDDEDRKLLRKALELTLTDPRCTTPELGASTILSFGRGADIGQHDALISISSQTPTSALELTKVLLENESSVDYRNGAAISAAVSSKNLTLLRMLLAKKPLIKSLHKPITRAATMDCNEETRFSIFQLLLPAGVEVDGLDDALLPCLLRGTISQSTSKLLLDRGASAGKALKPVIEAGLVDSLGLALQYATSSPDVNEAFVAARSASLDKKTRLELYRLLLVRRDVVSATNLGHALLESVKRDVWSTDIPRLLLEHGASVNYESALALRLAILAKSEAMTKLLLAGPLGPESVEAAFDVAVTAELADDHRMGLHKSLLERGVSCKSKTNALFRAIENGKIDLVDLLLSAGADPAARDVDGHTPLFNAVKRQALAIVSALLRCNIPKNDCSLHLAAEKCLPEVVSLLLDAGHEPMYPSPSDGSTPISVLCRAGKATSETPSRFTTTLQRLLPVSDLIWKQGGKSILHFAIENRHDPLAAVNQLIEVGEIWRRPQKQDEYMYINDSELCYSPTMYAKLLCPILQEGTRRAVVDRLEAAGFTDRYFARVGGQPPSACGFSPEVAARVQEGLQAEWDMRESMRRAEELAKHQGRLLAQEHQIALVRQTELVKLAERANLLMGEALSRQKLLEEVREEMKDADEKWLGMMKEQKDAMETVMKLAVKQESSFMSRIEEARAARWR